MNLPSKEFDYLLGLEKSFINDTSIVLGPPPQRWTRELVALSQREYFQLDYRRGTIEIKKMSLNNRYRSSIVLVRLCSNGIHTNPENVGGETFMGAHVHLYSEEYGDRIAYPVSKLGLADHFPVVDGFYSFLKYCNISGIPAIQTAI